jgi:hypothetical protein
MLDLTYLHAWSMDKVYGHGLWLVYKSPPIKCESMHGVSYNNRNFSYWIAIYNYDLCGHFPANASTL